MLRICSRCGRERRSDEVAGLGDLLSSMASEPDPFGGAFADVAPWARIDDADICPQCLTRDEEQLLARTYVELVEAEVTRVREAGADPQPYEAALIEYAMVLRSRIADAEVSDPEPGQELEVAIIGAFLTGEPVEARISEYSHFQRDLGEALRELPDQGWEYVKWRGIATYASGGGYASMVPLVLVRRGGPDFLARARNLFNQRPEPERRWLDEVMRRWSWRPRSMRVEVYDLGMAVITATYAVRLPSGVELATATQVIDAVVRLKPDPETQIRSPVAATLQALADETVIQFTRAVHDHASSVRKEPWLTPFLNALSPRTADDEAHVERWGRLLWLHPVFVVPDSVATSPATQRGETARPLTPTFHRSADLPDGTFLPGIGVSLIVAGPTAGGVEMAMRLTKLHWAYLAHYLEIDRGLLATLDDNRWHEPESLEALEVDAERTFGMYMRFMQARARLDSHLASLGGDELAIWNVIADVQKFDALVDGVDRKIDVLRAVAERRVQQAAANRARRTSKVLGALTALTVITVAVAVIAYLVGTRTDEPGHLELRWIVIAVAVLLAGLLYLLAHGEWARWRRKAARKP